MLVGGHTGKLARGGGAAQVAPGGMGWGGGTMGRPCKIAHQVVRRLTGWEGQTAVQQGTEAALALREGSFCSIEAAPLLFNAAPRQQLVAARQLELLVRPPQQLQPLHRHGQRPLIGLPACMTITVWHLALQQIRMPAMWND